METRYAIWVIKKKDKQQKQSTNDDPSKIDLPRTCTQKEAEEMARQLSISSDVERVQLNELRIKWVKSDADFCKDDRGRRIWEYHTNECTISQYYRGKRGDLE